MNVRGVGEAQYTRWTAGNNLERGQSQVAYTLFTVRELGAVLWHKRKRFLDAKLVLPTRKDELSRESWNPKLPSIGRLNSHPD